MITIIKEISQLLTLISFGLAISIPILTLPWFIGLIIWTYFNHYYEEYTIKEYLNKWKQK